MAISFLSLDGADSRSLSGTTGPGQFGGCDWKLEFEGCVLQSFFRCVFFRSQLRFRVLVASEADLPLASPILSGCRSRPCHHPRTLALLLISDSELSAFPSPSSVPAPRPSPLAPAIHPLLALDRSNAPPTADDASALVAAWNNPAGGLHAYLVRFLSSEDSTFQHIAVWTLVQCLEARDPQLDDQIRSAADLIALVRKLAESEMPSSSVTEAEDASTDGEREIVELAKTALELIEEE